MRSLFKASFFALGTCLAVSACGGGTGTVPASSAHAVAAPSLPGSTAPSSAHQGSVKLSVTIPPKKAGSSSKRAPRYVSHATDTIYLSVLSIDGTPVSGSSYVYAIPISSFTDHINRVTGDDYSTTISLPAGQLVVALGDGVGGSLVSYADGLNVTVTPGQTASLDATLNGVAAAVATSSFAYGACSPNAPAGSVFCSLSFGFSDPQGGMMANGSVANGPITVTASDTTNSSTAITLTDATTGTPSSSLSVSSYYDYIVPQLQNIPNGETDQVTVQFTFPASANDFGSAVTPFGGGTQSFTFSCTNAGCAANGDVNITVN
ncbi:MAG TPA: hypothetical protein VHS78_00990 [Candidatus Elarobacter sp.]|nr:hypothetical protein [Candidatus Elarobacter sp.]